MATINDVIQAYQYYKAPTFLVALNNVLKCRQYSKGVMSPRLLENIIIGGHQHRLKHHYHVDYKILKKEVKFALNNPFPILSSPTTYNDFEVLHNDLKTRLTPHGKILKGIQDLTLYDMALRIGYILLPKPVFPNKKIYLFRGAFNGYCELQKIMPHSLPLISSPGIYDMTMFSGVFDPLPSMFVEDMLCVYHKDFPNLPSMSFEDFQKNLCFGWNVPNIQKTNRYTSTKKQLVTI